MPRKNPSSPPAKIAAGLATKTGLGGAAAALVPVLVDLLSNDAISDQTRNLLLKLSAFLAAVTIIGRSAQAVAVELKRGPSSLGGHGGEDGHTLVELAVALLIFAVALIIILRVV